MSLNLDIDPRFTFDKADRIRRALRVSGVGVQELAEYLQVSRNTVSNWINGHASPRRRDLAAIALRTGYPIEWLESGAFVPAPTTPEGRASDYRVVVSLAGRRTNREDMAA